MKSKLLTNSGKQALSTQIRTNAISWIPYTRLITKNGYEISGGTQNRNLRYFLTKSEIWVYKKYSHPWKSCSLLVLIRWNHAIEFHFCRQSTRRLQYFRVILSIKTRILNSLWIFLWCIRCPWYACSSSTRTNFSSKQSLHGILW